MDTLNEAMMKLIRACQEATWIKKSRAHYGKYLNLNDILEQLNPILWEHGFYLVQLLDKEDLVTELVHVATDQKVVSRMTLQMGAKKDAQSQGSAITYARRYSLVALLGLAAEDDDGASTVSPSGGQTEPKSGTVASKTPRSRMQIGTS